MSSPPKRNAAGANRGARVDWKRSKQHPSNTSSSAAFQAVIAKSHSAQLRISLTNWRGDHKVELREATSSIPGLFFPTASGFTLGIAKLPELITALQAAEAEARRLGLLSNERRAA